jgi:hypothetical protein
MLSKSSTSKNQILIMKKIIREIRKGKIRCIALGIIIASIFSKNTWICKKPTIQ